MKKIAAVTEQQAQMQGSCKVLDSLFEAIFECLKKSDVEESVRSA
jgi:hypothetical protein